MELSRVYIRLDYKIGSHEDKDLSNLKHLDLFSGIGGFTLASQWVGGIETVQFVEIDSHVQKTLTKNFPGIPIHNDITTFSAIGKQYDLITAGFPCQDISWAGNGAGLVGKRSGLFYEVVRIISECRPSYVLLENVSALLSINDGRDMGTLLWELSKIGYDAEWEIIPASALGANHERKRIWIIAYPMCSRSDSNEQQKHTPKGKFGVLPTNKKREKFGTSIICTTLSRSPRSSNIAQFPRAYDGLSDGMDKSELRLRFKALGNAIVPQVAMIPLQRILDLHDEFTLETSPTD